MSDDELIALLKGNRKERNKGFEFIYSQAGRYINTIMRQGTPEEEAKDIFQDSLILLGVVINGGFELTARFSTFLTSICIKKAWQHNRKKNPLKYTQDLEFQPDEVPFIIEEENDNSELLFRLRDGREVRVKLEDVKPEIVAMGGRCKDLLLLSYFNKIKAADLVEELGYENANTVAQQKWQCRGQLKKLLVQKYKTQL
ncbi:MAG: hypothetical protein AAF632_26130 [Bacteroidota bacterium]